MANRAPALKNRILAALPGADFARLEGDLEPVTLEIKQMVYEIGEPFEHVYFVQRGVCSVIATSGATRQVEVATIGAEGMAGLPAFLGSPTSAMRAFVQVPGEGVRMEVERFRQHCRALDSLNQVLLRYTQAFITQIAQNSACNRMHAVDERCARWLLMTHDRVDADRFLLKQEFLGQMLGVRRTSVSAAAAALQQRGVIRYSRGEIEVSDRKGLEAAACECYAVVEAEYQRLLGTPTRAFV